MSENRILKHLPEGSNRAVLIQGSNAPILKGNNPEGFNYLCSVCNNILASGLLEGHVWNIDFRCHQCGSDCEGPDLPPGRPIPKSSVLTPIGSYLIGSSVDVKNACMVGESAIEQRNSELGDNPFPTFKTNVEPRRNTELDISMLHGLLVSTQILLEDDFDRLHTSYLKGQKSKTKSKNPHRLMYLYERVKQCIEPLKRNVIEDLNAIMELNNVIGFLNRFKNDPSWNEIKRQLIDPDNHAHSVVLMQTAAFLTDAGNSVWIYQENEQNIRNADLRTLSDAVNYMEFEVKAPRALQNPTSPLTQRKSDNIIDNAFRKARRGNKPQLHDNPCMLVVGGSMLHPSDIDLLERSANSLLRKKVRPKLYGISIVGVTGVDIQTKSQQKLDIKTNYHIRLARNPSYDNSIVIDNSGKYLFGTA